MRTRFDKQTTAAVIQFIQSGDDALPILAELAILTAFGVPFGPDGSQRMTGDISSGMRYNWTVAPASLDGRHETAKLMSRIRDSAALTDPSDESPQAIAAAAIQNLVTLIRFYIDHLPRIEVIKHGSKTLILSEGIPLRSGELLLKQLTKH